MDDYVGADNPVRFIDAFVDELDLSAAGFVRVAAEATGRPGYAPADLLKLYIYGYLNRVRSSRRLEMESHRNIVVIWLLRSLKPDFKTIADFRRDNRAAFRSVFRQFVLLCRRLDLYGRELLAVDGTRIKAVNNKDRNFTRNSLQDFIRAADERLDDYLRRLDEGDIEEGGTGGGTRTKNLAEKIEALRQKRGRYGAMLARPHAVHDQGKRRGQRRCFYRVPETPDRGRKRTIFLIVDRGPAHRAKKMKAFVETLGEKLRLFFPPPYSPDRNPDELVWKHLKADTVGRMAVTGKTDFKRKVRSSMCRLQNDPGKIRSLYQKQSLKYAA